MEETSIVRLNSIKQDIPVNTKNKTKAILFAPFATNSTKENTSIPSSLTEVKKIKKLVSGDIFMDEQAGKKVFMDEAKKYPIIHLATHSSINNYNPLKSEIFFYNNKDQTFTNNSIKFEELYGLKLNSELVTLSACETGIGKEVKGRGILSLSNALNYAGVSSTVMSLWKVPDKETEQIMVSFYKHLKNGETKDKALQNAKLDYLNTTSDQALKHPYYWAGFVISGDASPIKIDTPSIHLIWLVSGILVLIGLGLYFIKRNYKKVA